ncbi:MAG: TIGR03086 family metal-binding protein [Acidimicrobiia bacterium]|jgi:uncharacterized protein (TIGR03086 family)
MDAIALLKRVVDETDRLVEHTTPEDLATPTPCADWCVRDLLNHITGGATMFAVSAESGAVPDEMLGQLLGGDNLGDDYKGAWQVASRRALAAFDDPAVLDKLVTLPFGEMPAGVALSIAVFDVATHATDLARATGQKIDDEALLEAALAIGRQTVGPELRQPGVFDPEQPADPGAPVVDRLQAFAGRKL